MIGQEVRKYLQCIFRNHIQGMRLLMKACQEFLLVRRLANLVFIDRSLAWNVWQIANDRPGDISSPALFSTESIDDIWGSLAASFVCLVSELSFCERGMCVQAWGLMLVCGSGAV